MEKTRVVICTHDSRDIEIAKLCEQFGMAPLQAYYHLQAREALRRRTRG